MENNHGKHIVFFDGECFMCNRSMKFLLNIDQKKHLWFAPLQGETAKPIIERRDDLDGDLKSIVYIEHLGTEEEEAYLRSTAVLLSLRRIGGVWRILSWATVIPAGIRDTVYDFVARNRIRWFGSIEMCGLIPSEQREQLLP
ncbi:MAG: DCC1-like thiol-disulfide oxidoreductase family protein [Verrucomicrobiota bacterium]